MEEIKNILNKHRKIKLYHNKKWYKAKTITGVKNVKHRKNPCYHCNYGQSHTYIVSTQDTVCFCIDYWDGCLTYSGRADVISFYPGTQSEVEIYDKYFKADEANSDSQSSKDSDDTDSY